MPFRKRRYMRYMRPNPKFKIGDIAGEFSVVFYLGYSRVKPAGEPKILSQEHHWYIVRCCCGVEETHTQQHLTDTRRSRKCKKCLSQPAQNAHKEI